MDTPGYIPIACGLHDELQLRSMRRSVTVVRHTAEDGAHALTVRARILDVYARGGAEYLVLEQVSDGARSEIRLDRLLDVDGIPFNGPGC